MAIEASRSGSRWRLGAGALLLASGGWLGACGESSGSADAGADDSISTDDDGLPGDDLSGSGGMPQGGRSGASECNAPGDCPSGSSCHPIQKVCVTEGAACTGQEQCSSGTFCDATSQSCLPGLSGSPCAGDTNCQEGSTCSGGVCQCMGFQREQETVGGPLDIYFIFDRTASMGNDCEYAAGQEPPLSSKACFATYAMNDYLTTVQPASETRLAFQFMSYPDGCDGTPYSEPLEDFAVLPVPADHGIVRAISDEEFQGGSGTQIEGALLGIAAYTSAAATPGREMIGVLMTDGDPQTCVEDIDFLADIIAEHYAATGIRTFIIGMEGATEENLEQLAVAGGAEPHDDFCGSLDTPCHYWNVGDGSGDAIQSALQAIAGQATPFPCQYDLDEIGNTSAEEFDLNTLNVQLSDASGTTLIGKVSGQTACPADEPAWYFDSNGAPTQVVLCQAACDLLTRVESGAKLSIVGGCTDTVIFE